MPIENLTDSRVRGLKHADGEIIDAKSGAIARADREGRVSFSYRYRSGGARRRFIIGRYPTVSLAAARAEAGRVRELVRDGNDPQAERRERRSAPAAMNFEALCDLYIERYARPRKASWRGDVGFLRPARLAWGKREAATITRQEVARLLFELAASAPIAANRTRAVLLKMYGWAIDAGLLDLNPLLGVKKPSKESRGKTRTLSNAEIRLIWRALDTTTRIAPATIAALRVLILTGQRPGEVSGMAVDELHDLNDPRTALWAISAHRTKTRKAHIVPLPALAAEFIAAEIARPRAGNPEFVFASRYARRGQLARNSLSEALARLIDDLDDNGTEADVVVGLKANRPTPHDCRRTVATNLSKLGIPREDRLAVLGHSHGDVHEAHYDHFDRLPQKRIALEAWERHIRRVLSDEPFGGAEVITLRSAVT
jgi:integrase